MITKIIRRVFSRYSGEQALILPPEAQIRAWQRAAREMKWKITEDEFKNVRTCPELTNEERESGYIGTILGYGFRGLETEETDPVLSGRLAWDYILKKRRKQVWQCEYADFSRPQDLRLRPGAPARPAGFYWAKFHPGEKYKSWPVAKFRKQLN